MKSTAVQQTKPDEVEHSSQNGLAIVDDERASFLEFFAGSGLVTEGLKPYFRATWANDICEKKADVYRTNHTDNHFHLGPIADIKGHELPLAPLAWASFPCQDLSLAGWTEGIHGARSGLVWEWLRVIDEMVQRPRILVAENVAGLVSAAGGNHYRALHWALVERGYAVGAMLIDAVRWVPQSRPRVFVVAVDQRLEPPASLTSSGPNWLHNKAICRVANDLEAWIWWSIPEPAPLKQYLSDVIEWQAPLASEETNSRNISLIAPKHLERLNQHTEARAFVVPGYKRTRNGKQVLELRFDNLSGCLRTPEGGSSRQVIVIKKNGELKSRLLTVREAARLMGAPDTYKLPGTYNSAYKAMGDAVAVPVARALAKHLLTPLVKTNAKR